MTYILTFIGILLFAGMGPQIQFSSYVLALSVLCILLTNDVGVRVSSLRARQKVLVFRWTMTSLYLACYWVAAPIGMSLFLLGACSNILVISANNYKMPIVSLGYYEEGDEKFYIRATESSKFLLLADRIPFKISCASVGDCMMATAFFIAALELYVKQ